MGLPKPQRRTTVEEYMQMERTSDVRHLYVDGELFAMAGESRQHGSISVNLAGLFWAQLRGKSCQLFTKDTKVLSGPTLSVGKSATGMFSYPDLVFVCGEPAYHEAFADVIQNPIAIIEVLSPTTESFDRGEKFNRFQTWNPTLQDYLLVSQDQPRIEHFSRENNKWIYQNHVGLDAVLEIPSIACSLSLADVYERVTLSE